MPNPPATLDEIIAPLPRARFFSDYWTVAMLHQKGAKGRFSELLTWDALNAILEWNSPPQPQVRLFQDNQMVDVRRYIDGKVGALRLNAGGLVAALAQGATLVLDGLEGAAPHVSALTEALKDAVQGPVNANLYAGWRRQQGFDVHWDQQDVFVLQLSGRKHWKVWRPTRPHPLRDDPEEAPKPGPQDKPVFDAILDDGDMLYLPRGWWHMAIPLDEPSLHVTFGAMPPTGADFLHWWLPRLLRHEAVRANLPLQSDAAARRAWMERLFTLMRSEADPLDGFRAAHRMGRYALPRLRLPQAVLEQNRPITAATRIRLAATHSLLIDAEPDGRPALVAGGRRWIVRPELVPVFRRLSSTAGIPAQELCAGLTPDLVGTLMHALETLAGMGQLFKETETGP